MEKISIHSFSERIEFVRTVYLILAVQFGFCAICVIITAMDEEEWGGTIAISMQRDWFFWFISLIGIVTIPLLVYCNRNISRSIC